MVGDATHLLLRDIPPGTQQVLRDVGLRRTDLADAAKDTEEAGDLQPLLHFRNFVTVTDVTCATQRDSAARALT